MTAALLFCWQFAGKQTCWLHFCYIVFTGSHAEREIEQRLFGMLLYSHSSAFGRLPELLQWSAGELENSMRRGWVEGTLFYVYQADFVFFFFFCRGSFRCRSWFLREVETLWVLKGEYNHYPAKSACQIGLDLYREITLSSFNIMEQPSHSVTVWTAG